MAFERAVDIYLNTRRTPGQVLFQSKTSPTGIQQLQWISGDKFLVRLWFLEPSASTGQVPTVLPLPAGWTLAFGGKKALSDATLLFFIDTDEWSEVGAGDQLHYEAVVDLNTVELAAAFGADASVNATADVEVRNGDNSERITFQFRIAIGKQAYSDEGDPTPATPTYPAPGDLLTNAADSGNLKRGSEPLGSGDDAGAVAFATAFAEAPASVLAIVRAPDANGAVIFAVVHSITAAGFSFLLSGQTPDANHQLDWVAIK